MVHTTCAVRDCRSSSRINKDLRFHQLPRTEERCKLWMEACRRPDLHERSLERLKNIYICSLHFENDMYGKKSLKKTAIPTLSLPTKDITTGQCNDLEENIENYVVFKMMGSVNRVQINEGSVPSRFICENNKKRKRSPLPDRPEDDDGQKEEKRRTAVRPVEISTSSFHEDRAIKAATNQISKPTTKSTRRVRRVRSKRRKTQKNVRQNDGDCNIQPDTSKTVPPLKDETQLTDVRQINIPTIDVDIETERDVDMKLDIIEESLLCGICLSVGRKMFALGKYERLYKLLLLDKSQDQDDVTLSSMHVCWECSALLRSVDRLQRKVRKAYDMFYSQQDFTPLSSLKTVVLTDSNSETICIKKEDILTDNISIKNDDDNLIIDDEIEINREDKHTVKEEERSQENVDENESPLKNEKPKYEIINGYNEVFERVILDNNSLKDYLEEKRTEEIYKRSKFKCSNCIQSFRDASELTKHRRLYHNMRVRSSICNICQSRFSDVLQLAMHLRNHYNIFKCNLCSFKCANEDVKKTHEQLHGSKFLKCLECGKLFSDLPKFYSHYQETHEILVLNKQYSNAL